MESRDSNVEQDENKNNLNHISVVFDNRKSIDSDVSSFDQSTRRTSIDELLSEFDYKDHEIYSKQYRKILKTIMVEKSELNLDSSVSDRISQIESSVCELVNNTVRNPGSSHVIAQLVFYLYKHKYKVGRLKSKDWYMFNGLFWKQTEIGPYYELSTDVLNIYDYHLFEEKANLSRIHKNIKLMKQAVSNGKQDASNEHYLRMEQNQLSQVDERVSHIEKIIEKLKNVSSKESICKECLYLFYDDSFLHCLDTNPNLVCFQNGVVDLVNNKFRKGYPIDYLSIMIDMNFNVPSNEEEKVKLNEIFDKFHTYRKIIINKRRNRLIFTPTL
jgi:hypothetical protein